MIMDWMLILTNCFIAVLFTSITGSIVYLLWYLLKNWIGKLNPRLNYLLLKVVCFFYLVPVVFILIYVIRNYEGILYHAYVFAFDSLETVIQWIIGVFIVWGILSCCILVYRIYQKWRLKNICLYNRLIEEEKTLECFESVKEHLHIKKSIRLVKNEKIYSPMLMGITHPVIILPDTEYLDKELQMVFTHELMHYKNHDIWLKWCATLITVIHSYNPLSYLLIREVDLWTEVNCDICTCRDGCFRPSAYYTFILDQAEKILSAKENNKYIFSALFERNNELDKRMDCMKYYVGRTYWKTVIALVVIVITMGSGFIVSYAASSRITDGYQRVYETSVNMIEEIVEVIPDGEEYFVSVEDDTCENEVIVEDEISIEDVDNAIDWKIPGKTRFHTGKLKKSSGDTIEIMIKPSNEDEICVGIIGPENSMYYVITSDDIIQTFEIIKDGDYRIFVENLDEDMIEVIGLYW